MSAGHKPLEKPPENLSADRQVWAIAGPAIIANSSAPLVGLVDTWAIGHLPVATHLAAVGVGATVFSFLFWAFGFMRMSTTGLVAQANGRNDRVGMERTVVRSLVFGFSIAVGLIALQSVLFDASLLALSPAPAITALYQAYFDIRIWSAPAVLVTYGITGFLIGVKKAQAALVLQLVLNISNGGLNLVFVLGFGMGVEGIALGSLIAEWLAAVAGLAMLARYFGAMSLLTALGERTLWTVKGFLKLAQTNGFIFVRTLLLMTALTMVMREANSISEAAVAASHVMNVFMLLISLGLDGFAYAVEALAGAAYGKGVRHDFRKWVRVTNKWALLAALAYTAGFYLFGDMVIALLTDVETVRMEALSALPVIVWLPIVSVWCYQFDGIFIGATAAGAMMVTMALSFGVFIGIVGSLTEAYGLMGLWLAVVIFSGCRGLTQAFYYPMILRALRPEAGPHGPPKP